MSLPQTPTVRFRATHAVVGNAPQISSIPSDQYVLTPRTFTGSGAPNIASGGASDVLLDGNGKYCGTQSGWVLGASLVNPGSGYLEEDTMNAVGGTFAHAAQLIVDIVDGSDTGVILDFSTNLYGNYSVYPTNPVTVDYGDAVFNLALQPADYYLDYTGKALYVCITSGDKTTSAWQQISGGFWMYESHRELDPSLAYSQDKCCYVSPLSAMATTGMLDLATGDNLVAKPGIWMARKPIPAQVVNPAGLPAGTYFNVPQLPAMGTPSGTPLMGDLDNAGLYWINLSMASSCT
jgi:hypothetical protein